MSNLIRTNSFIQTFLIYNTGSRENRNAPCTVCLFRARPNLGQVFVVKHFVIILSTLGQNNIEPFQNMSRVVHPQAYSPHICHCMCRRGSKVASSLWTLLGPWPWPAPWWTIIQPGNMNEVTEWAETSHKDTRNLALTAVHVCIAAMEGTYKIPRKSAGNFAYNMYCSDVKLPGRHFSE